MPGWGHCAHAVLSAICCWQWYIYLIRVLWDRKLWWVWQKIVFWSAIDGLRIHIKSRQDLWAFCLLILLVFQFLSNCGEPIGDSGSRVVSRTILREKLLVSAAVIVRKQRCPLTHFLAAQTTKAARNCAKIHCPPAETLVLWKWKRVDCW